MAILLGVARALKERGESPVAPPAPFISSYEEVGHGSSAGLPGGTVELIAVDKAAVAKGQTPDAFAIDCRVNVYPEYASDVSQAPRAGWDVWGGLVGPGVDASHAFARLHRTSLEATARLLLACLLIPA